MFRRLLLALTFGLALLAPAQSTSTFAADAYERLEIRANFRAFDESRYPEARRRVLMEARDFPRLGARFEVIDPYIGKRYNCIAHSLGIHGRWVNPETGPSTAPLSKMDRMYTAKGYRRVSGLDFRLATGLQKVVVYAKVSGGRITSVTHAAIQEADGSWSSKLGQLPLIRHATPESLNGPSYGVPVAVYVRKRVV
ncbi:MAG: hypothetical protein U0793_26245 [Gemmataceae bacterium]